MKIRAVAIASCLALALPATFAVAQTEELDSFRFFRQCIALLTTANAHLQQISTNTSHSVGTTPATPIALDFGTGANPLTVPGIAPPALCNRDADGPTGCRAVGLVYCKEIGYSRAVHIVTVPTTPPSSGDMRYITSMICTSAPAV